jgi:hypothetical protein
MKHYIWYASSNKYERVPMECIKNLYQSNDDTVFGPGLEHEAYYKECFNQGQYSQLHMLVLRLDPANGITEVLKNEYMEGPLKQRITINPAAKPKNPVAKKKSISQLMAAHGIAAPQIQPEFWGEPVEAQDD